MKRDAIVRINEGKTRGMETQGHPIFLALSKLLPTTINALFSVCNGLTLFPIQQIQNLLKVTRL